MADTDTTAAPAGEDYSLTNPDTVTKYKVAGDIANRALKAVVDAAVAGAKVRELCELGDRTVTEAAQGVYRGKGKDGNKVERGIAFPTSVSINECVCHLSPLTSDKDIVLKDGDLVKIELGAHIDGLAATVATSLVVGATKDTPVTGRKADVLLAGYTAYQAALRLVKAGNKSTQLIEVVDKIYGAYNVKAVEGISSYSAKRNAIEGDKHFTQAVADGAKRPAEIEFAEGDVYNIDIIVSTGTGKTRQLETRTTIYRKTNTTYLLKLKASRAVFSEVSSKFGVFAFSLRALDDEKQGRLGIKECADHGLVTPYDVLYEKEGEVVAQFKYAVLLLPSGPSKVTTPLFDPATAKSEAAVTDPAIVEILAQSTDKKKKKKSKGKAAADGAAAAADGAEE